MTSLEVGDVLHSGRVVMPKVLVVEASGPFLEMQRQTADTIRTQYGLDPVFVPYSQSGVNGGKTAAEIVAHAKDPANGIAMVLTGSAHNSSFYGDQITLALRQGEAPFKGPIAMQMNGAPYAADIANAQKLGAIGMYNKTATEGTHCPYPALLVAHQKGLVADRV